MTLIHEKGSELHWKDVRELVVGEQRSPQGLLVPVPPRYRQNTAEAHNTVTVEDKRVWLCDCFLIIHTAALEGNMIQYFLLLSL